MLFFFVLNTLLFFKEIFDTVDWQNERTTPYLIFAEKISRDDQVKKKIVVDFIYCFFLAQFRYFNAAIAAKLDVCGRHE